MTTTETRTRSDYLLAKAEDAIKFGRFFDAMDDYIEVVLADDPHNRRAFFLKAQVLVFWEEWESAIAVLNRMGRLRHEEVILLGRAQVLLGRAAEGDPAQDEAMVHQGLVRMIDGLTHSWQRPKSGTMTEEWSCEVRNLKAMGYVAEAEQLEKFARDALREVSARPRQHRGKKRGGR